MEKDKDIIVIITDDKPEEKEANPTAGKAVAEDNASAAGIEGAEEKRAGKEAPEKEIKPKAKMELITAARENGRAVFARLGKYFSSLPRDLEKPFIKRSLAASAAMVAALSLGAYFMPKSESAVADGLERLMQKDSAYLEAKSAYDTAAKERDNLTSDLELKKQALEEFHGAQSSLDKITKSNSELEKTRDQLKKDISDRQSELEKLTDEQEKASGKITTLSSGYYTVGEDIAPGTYTITGTGSIAIANSGRSTANKLLKADGEAFTLKAGDRIQIEGSAKLSPQ